MAAPPVFRIVRNVTTPSLTVYRRAFLSTSCARLNDGSPSPAISIQPLKRTGEDDKTMYGRLLYQSRYRGTLESDLLLSTFAKSHLPNMTRAQMETYDEFLNEEDWDIYYWATQDQPAGSSPPTTTTTAGSPDTNSGAAAQGGEDTFKRKPGEGEWARTIGNFEPAYRPIPEKWRDSELLRLLREHVKRKSASREEGGMDSRPLLYETKE